jgi:hypothetical protein
VQCSDATASTFVTKVLVEVLAHFHAVIIKDTVVWGTDCLPCQDGFFVKSPLNVKENYAYALDFALHMSYLSGLGEFGFFISNTHTWLMLSSLNTCLIITRDSSSFFPRSAQNFMHTHCWIHIKIA